MTSKQPNFETSLDKLQKIVTKIEQGDLDLATAIKKYEEGTKLIQECRKILNVTEQKIKTATNE